MKEQAEQVTLLLGVELSTDPTVVLVERAEVDKVLAEQELTLTGAIEGESAAKVGQLLGAKILVTGRLMEIGKKRMAIAKMIGVETGGTVAISASFEGDEGVADAAKQLAAGIQKQLAESKSKFVADVETWDECITRLKALLPAGKALPRVKVSIPEQHLTRAVPDPAAETEIQKILQSLGFRVVTDGAADYSISGEAFSERGGQRGQMIFCKARLEVKVAAASSNEAWVDRETSSAIDLAEHVAGKSALQNAGRQVADRLVTQYFAKHLK